MVSAMPTESGPEVQHHWVLWLHFRSGWNRRGVEQCCERTSFLSPSTARARHFFLNLELGPKAKFPEWVKICTTAGLWWRSKVNINKLFTFDIFLKTEPTQLLHRNNWGQKCPSL